MYVQTLDTQLFVGLKDVVEGVRKEWKIIGLAKENEKGRHLRKMNRSMKMTTLMGIQLAVSNELLDENK